MSLSEQGKTGENGIEDGVKEVETRLLSVYDFAHNVVESNMTTPVARHVDYGTYNGFAISRLNKFAAHIDSFDIDPGKLWIAEHRPEVAALIASGAVALHHMDARAVKLPHNTYNSATIIEVFGAGFEGDEKDIQKVFQGVYKILTPGGIVVFTTKNKATQNMSHRGLEDKGFPMDPNELGVVLQPLFGGATWYGQEIVTETSSGIEAPMYSVPDEQGRRILKWRPEAYIPRLIKDPLHEYPRYWVGVCKKPVS